MSTRLTFYKTNMFIDQIGFKFKDEIFINSSTENIQTKFLYNFNKEGNFKHFNILFPYIGQKNVARYTDKSFNAPSRAILFQSSNPHSDYVAVNAFMQYIC